MKTLPVLKPHSKLWRGLPHLFSQNYWESPFPLLDVSAPRPLRLPLFLVSPPCSLRPPLLHGPQHYSTTTVNIITLNLLFHFPWQELLLYSDGIFFLFNPFLPLWNVSHDGLTLSRRAKNVVGVRTITLHIVLAVQHCGAASVREERGWSTVSSHV